MMLSINATNMYSFWERVIKCTPSENLWVEPIARRCCASVHVKFKFVLYDNLAACLSIHLPLVSDNGVSPIRHQAII